MAEAAEHSGNQTGPKVFDADELIDEILARKGPVRYTNGLSEENWEEELERIPLFMTQPPSSVDPDLSPDLAALQALKYEMETADGRATTYKEEGNECFRVSRYREAVKEYTAGLKEKPDDNQLSAVLYTNRAAAHFHLANYRSSLLDATQARTIKPDHTKALLRGALTCAKLQRYGEAIQWCHEGLAVDPDNSKLKDVLREATTGKKRQERDARKQTVQDRKQAKEDASLLEAIKSRGVSLATDGSDTLVLMGPHPSGGRVHVNELGHLVWPVLFVYPEYGQTDWIEAFSENDRMCDHLEVMFGRERVPWDREWQYRPESIVVYFENVSSQKLTKVKVSVPLGTVLQMTGYQVHNGTPSFILLAVNSAFHNQFINGKT